MSPNRGLLLKETLKRETVLLGPLERHLLRRQEEEVRDTTQLHPSEMAKNRWCPRHDYYQLIWPETRQPEVNRFQTELIYENGHQIHDKYQSWFAEMGVIWGRWRCKGCKRWWWGWSSDIDYCVCGAMNWQYREVPLSLPSHAMLGSSDGVVRSQGKNWLLEIKSIGPGTIRVNRAQLYKRYTDREITLEEMWKEIRRPFPDHVRQAMLYLRMCKEWALAVGQDVVPEINDMVLLYEWKPNQAVKEFTLSYDESLIADTLQDAQIVAASLQNGMQPHRPGWSVARGPETTTCKACTYHDHCWSDQLGNLTTTSAPERTTRPPKPAPVTVRSVSGADRRKRLGNVPTSV